MRSIGTLLALAGLALAVTLFAQADARAIFTLVAGAGAGLILAGLFHILPMLLNALAWQALLPGRTRTHRQATLFVMTCAVWVRESVNGLLPVARIGGEIVSYRLLRQQGLRGVLAAASLVVDMALSVLSQLVFALAGVGLLIAAKGPGGLAGQLLLGLLIMVPAGMAFVLVQHAGAFETFARGLNKLAAGRLVRSVDFSIRTDRAVRAMYGRRSALAACFGWQIAGWLAGAGEIWLALMFLDRPVGIATAMAIEALIQAASSVAFLVPAAIGIQEGAFVVIGAAFGLDRTSALALASARRLRDVTIFFPGLLAWQWTEARGAVPGWAKQRR